MTEFWAAPTRLIPLRAETKLPGSKSLTNRELMLSALAREESLLHRPLRARDTQLMTAAVQVLGTQIIAERSSWRITPGRLHAHNAVTVDCGLAGTVMRFVPLLAALNQTDATFDGDAAARARPMAETIAALRSLDVEVTDQGRGVLPFTVHGTGSVDGGRLQIDSAASSQFISALLLVAPAFTRGLTLTHTGDSLPSLTHIAMTVSRLRSRGVEVDDSEPGRWQVAPGPIAGAEVDIEPDLSNAGPFIAAALVTGGSMCIHHWPRETDQPGRLWTSIIEQFGGTFQRDGSAITFYAGRQLSGVDLDLQNAGELTPVVTAIAALAATPSRLRGIGHLRGHETDRLDALTTQINKMGGRVTQSDDGLRIEPAPLHGTVFHTYEDHRMAHAAAVLGLRVPDVQVENIETTSKTYPGFAPAWELLTRP